MPRHSVVERSCIAFSMKIFLEIALVEDATHCCLQLSSAGLIVVMVPWCC